MDIIHKLIFGKGGTWLVKTNTHWIWGWKSVWAFYITVATVIGATVLGPIIYHFGSSDTQNKTGVLFK